MDISQHYVTKLDVEETRGRWLSLHILSSELGAERSQLHLHVDKRDARATLRLARYAEAIRAVNAEFDGEAEAAE